MVIVFIVLQVICNFVSVFLIGLGTDFVVAGEYKELLFVFGCVVEFIPMVVIWAWFWVKCIFGSRKK